MAQDLAAPPLRVVLLTTGRRNVYGRAIWRRLTDAGVIPAGSLVEEGAPRMHVRDVLLRIRRDGLRAAAGAALRKVGLGGGPASQAAHASEAAHASQDAGGPYRGMPHDIVAASEAAGIPSRVVANVNGEDAAAFLREVRADLVVLAGSRILRRRILEVPRMGVINAHMAPLPGRRGMNVAEWGLWEGGETGVTVHLVDPGVDTGPILVARRRPREPGEDLAAFRRALFALQVELIGRAVEGLRDGTVRPEVQPQAPSRQYFTMHPRLRALLAAKLAARDGPRTRRGPMHGAGSAEPAGRADPAHDRSR